MTPYTRRLVPPLALFAAALLGGLGFVAFVAWSDEPGLVPPADPRHAFEVCAVECRDAEIGMRLARVDLRHHTAGGGFTCVCERSER